MTEDSIITQLYFDWYKNHDYDGFQRLCEIARQQNSEGKWEKYPRAAELISKRKQIITQLDEFKSGRRFMFINIANEKEEELRKIDEELTNITFELSQNFKIFYK